MQLNSWHLSHFLINYCFELEVKSFLMISVRVNYFFILIEKPLLRYQYNDIRDNQSDWFSTYIDTYTILAK